MTDPGPTHLVVQLDPREAKRTEALLAEEGLDLEPCPHAFFRARAEGCVLTFFRSGKLLIQGPATAKWARWAAAQGAASAPAGAQEGPAADPTIGSDESGKGDYFGPLVVAAVFLPPEKTARLREAGVRDCKELADLRTLQLCGWLERELPVAKRVLPPADYNRRYREEGSNLNLLLTSLHAEVLRELRPRLAGGPGGTFLVDRFGPEERLARALAPLAQGERLVQVPRAEAHPAVAAASIVARAWFLEGLKECGEEAAEPLPKGAGPPVLAAARRLGRLGGRELLGKVAKLHFKITGQAGL